MFLHLAPNIPLTNFSWSSAEQACTHICVLYGVISTVDKTGQGNWYNVFVSDACILQERFDDCFLTRHCTWIKRSMLMLFLNGGGFFLTFEGFGEGLTIHSPLVLFFFFFLKVEISSHSLVPLFSPGSVHSGSASWGNCFQEFPDKLLVSLFSPVIGSHTMPVQHSQPTRTSQTCTKVCVDLFAGIAFTWTMWTVWCGVSCPTTRQSCSPECSSSSISVLTKTRSGRGCSLWRWIKNGKKIGNGEVWRMLDSGFI